MDDVYQRLVKRCSEIHHLSGSLRLRGFQFNFNVTPCVAPCLVR